MARPQRPPDLHADAARSVPSESPSEDGPAGVGWERPAPAVVLAASQGPMPAALPLVVRAGVRDVESGAAELHLADVEAIAAELRAVQAQGEAPKDRGKAFYFAAVQAHHGMEPLGRPTPAGRMTRDAVHAVSAVVVDVDGKGDGAPTLAQAAELFRAAGLAAVLYPSPSAPAHQTGDAVRFRVLPLLTGPPSVPVFLRHVRALEALLRAALGDAVDVGTLRPESACYVQPRPGCGPRPPCAVVAVRGEALDLEALDLAAVQAGYRTAGDVEGDRRAARDGWVPRSAPDLTALVARLGYLGGAVRPGSRALRCPRAHWHGAPDAPGSSAAVWFTSSGYAHCSHDHSQAPEGERGTAGTRRVLGWMRADLAAAGRIADAAALDAQEDHAEGAHLAAQLRAELAAPAPGEAPRRGLHVTAVPEELGELLQGAVRRRRCVLATPTVGAGKSRAVPAAIAAVWSELPRGRDGGGGASAGVLCATVDAGRELAGLLALAGFDVRVCTPVHRYPGDVADADPEAGGVEGGGRAGCLHQLRAKRAYDAGLSARAAVCSDIPGEDGGQGTRCPQWSACRARADRWLPWRVVDGQAVPAPGAGGLGGGWVAVATHASAEALSTELRPGAALVVDEGGRGLEPCVVALDAPTLDRALRWASALRGTRAHGPEHPPGGTKTALPRLAAEALVRAVLALGTPAQLADVADPLTWCADALTAAAATRPALARAACDALAVPEGGTLDARDAVRWWCEHLHVRAARDRRRASSGRYGAAPTWDAEAPPPEGAGALAGLRAWAQGGAAVVVGTDPAKPPAAWLAWRSPATVCARAVLAQGGGVLALDATGDPATVRGAVGDAGDHVPLAVDDAATVTRTLAASGRGTRSHLCARRAVRWSAVGELLRGALAAVGCPEGGTVCFTHRPVADALRGGCEGAPPDLKALVADAARRGWRWSYFGAADSRGSNEHRAVSAVVVLGDARPPLDACRAEALQRLTAEHLAPEASEPRGAVRVDLNTLGELARSIQARRASEAAAQAFGRARAVQRHGGAVTFLHVGRIPALDWHQREGVVVLPLAALQPAPGALAVGAPELASLRAVDPAPPPPEVQPHPECPAPLALALRGGWSVRDVAAACGVPRETVARWARAGAPPEPRTPEARKARRAHLAALATLTPGGEADVRAWYQACSSGRGRPARVLNLAVEHAAGLGVALDRVRFVRWLEASGTLPTEALGALGMVLPAVVGECPTNRPPPTLTPALDAPPGMLAVPVRRADGSVRYAPPGMRPAVVRQLQELADHGAVVPLRPASRTAGRRAVRGGPARVG